MTNGLLKRRLGRRGLLALMLLPLLGALFAAPFLLTTQIVNFVLRQIFPAHRLAVASASLNLSGVLVLHNLLLHDTGAMAQEPLIAVHEVDAVFRWTELLSRQIRQMRADDVIVYVRSNGPAPNSLSDLFFELARARAPAASRPLWIGSLDVRGVIHREITGFGAASSDLPLALRMYMFGSRLDPSRRVVVSIGGASQMIGRSPEKPRLGELVRHDRPFGLQADLETRPASGGTRVFVHSFAATNANATIEADSLRQLLMRSAAGLPQEIQGSIEAGAANLSGFGELDLPGTVDARRLSGTLVFAGLRLHLPGTSKLAAALDHLAGSAKFDTPLPPGPGTVLTIERLEAGSASAQVEATTLRHHVGMTPSELQGPIESSIRNFSASGKLDLRPGNGRLAGRLAFSGLTLRVAGSPKMKLGLDNVDGAASIDSDLLPPAGTTITINQLRARNASASIDADLLRRYVRKMPAGLQGRVGVTVEPLNVSGLIASGTRRPPTFRGTIGLQNLDAHSTARGGDIFSVHRLTASASVDSRLDRWEPETLGVRDGTMKWSELSYAANTVKNLEASWRVADRMLTIDRFAATISDGQINGSPQLDLVTLAMPASDFRINHLDMHKALANLSPDRVDADGTASGTVHLMVSNEHELSGYVNLAFDGPGTLFVGRIAEVERMLVGNFGADLAGLAMHDLERYPFKEGSLHLESQGKNSLLKVRFVRQARTAADKTQPRKEIINGKEVWVGSLVVPTIDMTIPITGKSLAEMLSMISGFHALIRTEARQPTN